MTELRPVLTDLGLVEAPRWHDGRLVFSDWGARTVLALDQVGRTETLATVDGMLPFCTDRRPDGRLLVLTQAGLMSREPDSTLALYADLGGLSDYAWNDIVVDGRGNCYVNNIGFEFGGEFAPGLIALVTPDSSVRQVADGLAFPNGMAVTPDNSTLIVAESYGGVLTAYDIDDEGSLSRRRVWADLAGAAPDGICVDAEGAVWFAEVPGQRCVRVAEGGEVRQTLDSDLGCFACMLGGSDRRTLYVTAAAWPDAMTPGSRTGKILQATVEVPGAGWPG
ncbi:MAG TPA: SMP-30/gluconolactonase/LRE family protein [Propionibacteriaceae bacterium]|nr:SMP-30/gluconolactonase/LRE family protein [Propionibacteriaceae bacterium]